MRRWLISGVAALVVLGALTYAALRWWLPPDHRATIGAGPVDGTILVGPVDGTNEQSRSCDGVADEPLVRLKEPIGATAVALCAPADGAVRHLEGGEQLSELVAAYAEPDVERGLTSYCLAYAAVPHAVVLTVDSGERLRLAIPVDPCGHPLPRAERAAERAWNAAT